MEDSFKKMFHKKINFKKIPDNNYFREYLHPLVNLREFSKGVGQNGFTNTTKDIVEVYCD